MFENIKVDNGLLISCLVVMSFILFYLSSNVLKAVAKLPATIELMNELLGRFNKLLESHEQVEKKVTVLGEKMDRAERDIKDLFKSDLNIRDANHETREMVSTLSGKQWILEEKLDVGKDK